MAVLVNLRRILLLCFPKIIIIPEDGNCNVYRNVGKPSMFDAAQFITDGTHQNIPPAKALETLSHTQNKAIPITGRGGL
jgi:hypothetical protein